MNNELMVEKIKTNTLYAIRALKDHRVVDTELSRQVERVIIEYGIAGQRFNVSEVALVSELYTEGHACRSVGAAYHSTRLVSSGLVDVFERKNDSHFTPTQKLDREIGILLEFDAL